MKILFQEEKMMIDEKSFNKIASIVLLAILVLLTFFILRPILVSTVFALILAFIFYPVHKKFLSWIRSKNLSALLTCGILLLIIILPLLFLTPIIVKQAFQTYSYFQKKEILTPFNETLSPEVYQRLNEGIKSFASKIDASFSSELTSLFLNSPIIFLHLLLILFVFFFALRDGDKLVIYIQSLSPLSKESEKKVFQQFKDITHSVIFGQIVVGIIQGIVTGIALFVLGIENALILTLIAMFVGVLPIIGPWLVWVPVDVYLFLSGKSFSGFFLLFYGIFIISWVDTLIRPIIVSKKTRMNSAIVLVSMVGGLFVFGILGLIIGPLVISYLILILESYRTKKTSSILIEKEG